MASVLTGDQVLDVLNWRYAVKKFDPSKKLAPDVWTKLEQATLLAVSSSGVQPYRLLVISDQSVKDTLAPISYNQSQPKDCSHFVVFCSRVGWDKSDIEAYMQRIMRIRGVTSESLDGFRASLMGKLTKSSKDELDSWTRAQTYIALGFLVYTAAVMGIDACPMEGIDGPAYDKKFGLTEKGYKACAAVAVGYRDPSDPAAKNKKVRLTQEEGIFRV